MTVTVDLGTTSTLVSGTDQSIVVETSAGTATVVSPTSDVNASFLGFQGPPGVEPRGAWESTATYNVDDIVTQDGSSWIASKQSTGVDPAADVTRNHVGSFVSPGLIALGSPQAIATGFKVDRTTYVVALNIATAFGGNLPSGMTAGIASAINVPGFGIEWMGHATPTAQGIVTLDTTVTLQVGTRYWLVLLGATGTMIDQGPDMVASHMIWTGEFWYGTTEPSTNFGTYASPVVLYGSTGDSPWQVFASKGAQAQWIRVTQAEYDAIADPNPSILYVVIG